MTEEEFFKFQAKNLLHDFQTFKAEFLDESEVEQFTKRNSKLFSDDLFMYFDLDEAETLSLMQSQHITAQIAGFRKWNDLLKADSNDKKLAKLVYENTNSSDDVEQWKWYYGYANLAILDSASRLLVAQNYFKNRRKPDITTRFVPDIIEGPEAERALKREMKNMFGNQLKLDSEVKCIHCGQTFLCREMKMVRPVANKFDNRPMAMCKNYPDCDGSIIDLLEPEEYVFE